eukprot:1162100-Pelagomonas_calceolata.AAC.15
MLPKQRLNHVHGRVVLFKVCAKLCLCKESVQRRGCLAASALLFFLERGMVLWILCKGAAAWQVRVTFSLSKDRFFRACAKEQLLGRIKVGFSSGNQPRTRKNVSLLPDGIKCMHFHHEGCTHIHTSTLLALLLPWSSKREAAKAQAHCHS